MVRENEMIHIQVRLFRMACKRWNMDYMACADIFEKYDVDRYILDAYEFFHVQGDEANIEEIEMYLKKQGAAI